MRKLRTHLAGALALALLALPVATGAARAADDAAIRQHISADVAAGLARHDAAGAQAPRALTSHPAILPGAAPAAAPHAAAAPAAPAAPATPDSTLDGIWADLLAGNARFVAGTPRAYPLVRERDALVGSQHPRAIVLGCSDSRVGPEIVFDQSLGDLFVVRTAGNIVDPIALGSIEYAAEHLHARLLVVLGHASCGAVKAAAAGGDMPSTHLQAIVDRIRPTVQRLSNCFEGDELIDRSAIANARQSAADVLANSEILRTAVAHGELRVMSAIYDLRTGAVTAVSAPGAAAQATTPAH